MGTAIIVKNESFADSNLGKINLKNNVAISGLEIDGPNTVNMKGNTARYFAVYTPYVTSEREIVWIITDGASYADISADGMLSVKENAVDSTVTIKVMSISNPAVYSTKTIKVTYVSNFINFADAEVERICLANFDKDGDGKISYDEAASVTSLNKVLANNKEIKSFVELKYFTNVTLVEDDFLNCTNLADIEFPPQIKFEKNRLFSGCEALKITSLRNDYVGALGVNVFYNCKSATFDTIPAGVTEIKASAMYQCIKINKIKMLPANPPILENVNALCTTGYGSVKADIYVIDQYYDAYASAENWSDYATAGKLHKLSEW